MILPSDGREYYSVQITADDLDDWEASFDGKVTWVAGTLKDGTDDTYQWLVQGPDFNASDDGVPDESAATVTGRTTPFIRAKATPEYVVRTGPPIIVLDRMSASGMSWSVTT